MDNKTIAHLRQIYNTLYLVETKGESTRIMSKCLDALESFILKQENKEE